MKLVLASKSPRRSEILRNAGIDFTVRVADADETIPDGTKPEDAVVFLAARKALAVERAEDETVLGADTIVVLDDKILGKPKDREDAYNMLRSLSGRVHSVFTGVCHGNLSFVKKISFFKLYISQIGGNQISVKRSISTPSGSITRLSKSLRERTQSVPFGWSGVSYSLRYTTTGSTVSQSRASAVTTV